MAVRALIPAERLNIAHVNSVDGSTDYESGTEYKAGTVVTYNGNTYVANIDIEDTDTDTPDAAPDKWGLCPNARSLVEGGEMADLETRVAALEGDVQDITDLNGYAFIDKQSVEITPDDTKSVSENLLALYEAAITYVGSLTDTYWNVYRAIVESTYLPTIYNNITKATSFNVDFLRIIPAASEVTHTILYLESNTKSLRIVTIANDGTYTFNVLDSNLATPGSVYKLDFNLFKKIP